VRHWVVSVKFSFPGGAERARLGSGRRQSPQAGARSSPKAVLSTLGTILSLARSSGSRDRFGDQAQLRHHVVLPGGEQADIAVRPSAPLLDSRTTSHPGVGKRLRRGFSSGPAIRRCGSLQPQFDWRRHRSKWLRAATVSFNLTGWAAVKHLGPTDGRRFEDSRRLAGNQDRNGTPEDREEESGEEQLGYLRDAAHGERGTLRGSVGCWECLGPDHPVGFLSRKWSPSTTGPVEKQPSEPRVLNQRGP
jgi:hypothetical protein